MSRFSDLDYWKEEIPEEWHDLLDTFCNLCSLDINYRKMPEVVLIGVKEKRGQLFIYYNGGDTRTDAYSDFASFMSLKIKEE